MRLCLLLIFLLLPTHTEMSGCLHDCSRDLGQGHCVKDTITCSCQYGYFKEDCSAGALDEVPGLWLFLQIFAIIIFGSLGFLVAYIFFSSFVRKQDEEKPGGSSSQSISVDGGTESKVSLSHFNIKRLSLLAMFILCLDILLSMIIDPFKYYRWNTPQLLTLGLALFLMPLLSLHFIIVVAHWAAVYNKTVQVLRREEMLSKINQKYESNVTLEDVLKNVKLMSRLQVPFFAIQIIAFAVTITHTAVNPYRDYPEVQAWSIFFVVFFCVLYFCECIGFIIFGNKLVSLMPRPLQAKMIKVTRLNTGQAILTLAAFLMAFIQNRFARNPTGFVITLFFMYLAVMGIIIVNLVNITSRRTKFPYCLSFLLKIDSSHSSEHISSTTSVELVSQQ